MSDTKPAFRPGQVAFVRVIVNGPPMENSYVPSVPVTEIDKDGVILGEGYAHPDSIITPEDIRMKLLTRGGE